MKPGQKLLIVFDPEGGLAEEEITALREHKFVPCSLYKNFKNRNGAVIRVKCCFVSF